MQRLRPTPETVIPWAWGWARDRTFDKHPPRHDVAAGPADYSVRSPGLGTSRVELWWPSLKECVP